MVLFNGFKEEASKKGYKKIIISTCINCPYVYKEGVDTRCSLAQKYLRGYDIFLLPDWCPLPDNE